MWGAGYDADVHLLRMTIRNLRLKLDAAAPGESYIATEYGLGYRLTGRAVGRATSPALPLSSMNGHPPTTGTPIEIDRPGPAAT